MDGSMLIGTKRPLVRSCTTGGGHPEDPEKSAPTVISASDEPAPTGKRTRLAFPGTFPTRKGQDECQIRHEQREQEEPRQAGLVTQIQEQRR